MEYSSRRARVIASTTAVLAALTTVVTVPSTVTAAEAPTVEVDVVSITSGPFTLTRKDVATVEVVVHLVVPDGQRVVYQKDGRQVRMPALVDSANGNRQLPRTALTRVSGNRTDGVWSAEVPVGAVNRGKHRFSVQVCPTPVDCPADGPVVVSLGERIEVDGSDWPVLTGLSQDPRRLPDGTTKGATVTGTVVYSDSRQPARRVDVALARSPSAEAKVADTTGAKGRFTAPWPWPAGGASRLLAQTTAGSATVVHDAEGLGMPATGFKVRTGGSDAVIRPGEGWRISGTVGPAAEPIHLGKVKLQQRTGRGWRTIDTARVTHQPGERWGRFTFRHRFPDNGTVKLRVYKDGATCGPKRCQIAPDRSGLIVVVVGSPAYLVERQLRALGVPGGTVDGTIDVRARQALCAWRDMTGRKPSRDGLTGSLARSILGTNRLPRAKRTDGLYVNKTCQVLFQVVNHKYRRVVWVSTGMPGYDTPNGTGAIYRKRPGFVESTLYPGAFMFYPMNFFTDRPAIALHGSVSNSYVAPYPASHGCIRVWRPQIRKIYAESPLGTKVQVYGSY